MAQIPFLLLNWDGRTVTVDELLRVCKKPFLSPGLSGGRIWVPWALSARLFCSSDQPSYLPFPFILPIPLPWREGRTLGRAVSLSTQWPPLRPYHLLDARLFTPASWEAAKAQLRQTAAPLELAVWSVASVGYIRVGLVINQS